ncbi:MAG TPA: glycosyltransferase family 4 protein [Marmoricola sp.]
MRILHISDMYPPRLGGIEAHVHGIAHRQAARGDEVTVLTRTPADAEHRHVDDAGAVRVWRVRSINEGVDRALAGGTAAFDVVHAHVSSFAPFTSPVAARLTRRGLPTVVTVHSMWGGYGPWPGAYADLQGLRRAPVTWTAVSRVAASQMSRQLPHRTPIAIVPNAVEAGPRACTPQRMPDEPVRLVSTMRIARRKRPLPLLAMFARLVEATDRPLHLTVVGDGPKRQRFDTAVEGLGLVGRVTVTGRVEPPEVLASLRQADIYVAPAVLESFGLAALEARCIGLPVVGRAASGLTEFVVDGVEGALCASDHDMVTALRRLVEDDESRLRIAEHNRTTRSPLTWAHALERHDQVYDLAGFRSRARRAVPLAREGK